MYIFARTLGNHSISLWLQGCYLIIKKVRGGNNYRGLVFCSGYLILLTRIDWSCHVFVIPFQTPGILNHLFFSQSVDFFMIWCISCDFSFWHLIKMNRHKDFFSQSCLLVSYLLVCTSCWLLLVCLSVSTKTRAMMKGSGVMLVWTK